MDNNTKKRIEESETPTAELLKYAVTKAQLGSLEYRSDMDRYTIEYHDITLCFSVNEKQKSLTIVYYGCLDACKKYEQDVEYFKMFVNQLNLISQHKLYYISTTYDGEEYYDAVAQCTFRFCTDIENVEFYLEGRLRTFANLDYVIKREYYGLEAEEPSFDTEEYEWEGIGSNLIPVLEKSGCTISQTDDDAGVYSHKIEYKGDTFLLESYEGAPQVTLYDIGWHVLDYNDTDIPNRVYETMNFLNGISTARISFEITNGENDKKCCALCTKLDVDLSDDPELLQKDLEDAFGCLIMTRQIFEKYIALPH